MEKLHVTSHPEPLYAVAMKLASFIAVLIHNLSNCANAKLLLVSGYNKAFNIFNVSGRKVY